MANMKRFRGNHTPPVLAVVLLLAVLAACTGPQIQDVKQKYLLARMEYNDLLEEHLDLKAQQTPTVKADWKRTIDPKFKAVEAALTTWDGALEAVDGDPVTAEKTFMAALGDVKALQELQPIVKEDE